MPVLDSVSTDGRAEVFVSLFAGGCCLVDSVHRVAPMECVLPHIVSMDGCRAVDLCSV